MVYHQLGCEGIARDADDWHPQMSCFWPVAKFQIPKVTTVLSLDGLLSVADAHNKFEFVFPKQHVSECLTLSKDN